MPRAGSPSGDPALRRTRGGPVFPRPPNGDPPGKKPRRPGPGQPGQREDDVVSMEVIGTSSIRGSETGWATARRLRGKGIRTWVRATADGGRDRPPRGDDWNVVRGED